MVINSIIMLLHYQKIQSLAEFESVISQIDFSSYRNKLYFHFKNYKNKINPKSFHFQLEIEQSKFDGKKNIFTLSFFVGKNENFESYEVKLKSHPLNKI